MNKDEHDILKETIMDAVHLSHSALSKTFSDSNYEFKATLAVIMEKQDTTNEWLKTLNGKSVTNTKDINELKLDKKGFISSLRTAKWVVSITIGTIAVLGIYAYNGDKSSLRAQTEAVAIKADSVATELKSYQTEAQTKQGEIIKLLQALVKQK